MSEQISLLIPNRKDIVTKYATLFGSGIYKKFI
jgi:hypothetical protein